MLETQRVQSLNAIIIKVNNEKYLLEVKDVKEIFIPRDKIVPIPLSENDIVGVIDIRGDIYTILSLRSKIFKKETGYKLDNESRILLLELEGVHLALLVDSVLGVKKIPASIFKAEDTIVETQIDYQYIKSIGVLEEETYILLDLDALLPPLEGLKEMKPRINLNKQSSGQGPKQESKVIRRDDGDVIIPRVPRAGKNTGPVQRRMKPVERDYSINTSGRIHLTDHQRDVLQEIGNIGSGNAITALSRLIKKKIDVELTNVGIITPDNLADQFGGSDKMVTGIFCNIKDPSNSTLLQIFEMQPLLKLVEDLAGKDSEIKADAVKGKDDLDDFAISTVKEMGNILAGHYASALADLTGSKLMIDIPEFTMSKAGSLGDFLINELDSIADFIILIKTSITVADMHLNGVFFFIPDMETLKFLFKRLNISFNYLSSNEIAGEMRKVDVKNLKLNEIQRDALQEVGNMGAGNAANALAKMLNRRVDINIPSVEMTKLDYFAKKICEEGKLLFICWSNVKGKANATVLSIFDVPDIIDLTSIIIDDENKKKIDMRRKYDTIDLLPELYRDAMSELGHILGSNYTNAIGDLLDMRLMTEPPDLSIDTGEKFFKAFTQEIGVEKDLSIIITTNVIITDIKVTGTFLFIPEITTVSELLNALSQFFE
ncbi:hypothetical protein GF325_06875 [Candidatus Bathyarchaeota archaeon]|nr:hypothetical protein [Candidatus Bathyarchaeota archaeon]